MTYRHRVKRVQKGQYADETDWQLYLSLEDAQKWDHVCEILRWRKL